LPGKVRQLKLSAAVYYITFFHIYSLFPSQPDSFKMLSAVYDDVYLLSSTKSYSYRCSVKSFHSVFKK